MFQKILSYFRHPSKIIIFFASRNILKLDDEKYLKLQFKVLTGKKLNISNPQNFNEKLQWLKLHDKKEIYTTMVDKYEAKEYVSKIIGEEYVIPTLGLYNSFDEIDFDKLPNQFVIKCTHDSGGIVIVKDKKTFDKNKARKKIEKCLSRNFFYLAREWPYKNVKPRIIIEKYIEDKKEFDLKDYKFFTFSGKVFCIQVDYDRFTNHHRNFYTTDWEYMPFAVCYPTNPEKVIDKPKNLELMLHLSEKLADSIGNPKFARIDMYEVNGKIFFGEVTFYHGGGTEKFSPEEYNYKLGDLIKLDETK
jgi:hypothetical protein